MWPCENLELGIIMRQIKFVPTGVPDRLMWPISFRKHSRRIYSILILKDLEWLGHSAMKWNHAH